MIPTTKAQRKSLLRIYERTPLYAGVSRDGVSPMAHGHLSPCCPDVSRAISYREFRKMCVVTYGQIVCVPWCGMWLGVEPDGYAHS